MNRAKNDPHVAFPPISPLEEYGTFPVGPDIMMLREGFKYTITDASLEGGRFRFKASQGEILDGWCAMQTPYGPDPGGYRCAPTPFRLDNYPSNCTVPDASGSGTVSAPIAAGFCAAIISSALVTKPVASLDPDSDLRRSIRLSRVTATISSARSRSRRPARSWVRQS
jgi:hypothetical protein